MLIVIIPMFLFLLVYLAFSRVKYQSRLCAALFYGIIDDELTLRSAMSGGEELRLPCE